MLTNWSLLCGSSKGLLNNINISVWSHTETSRKKPICFTGRLPAKLSIPRKSGNGGSSLPITTGIIPLSISSNKMQFKAAVLTNQNQPLEIISLEVPKLCFGQVLVKLICSGICGSQIGEINGIKGKDPWLPHLLGHEGCAEVLECGEGVTTVKYETE